MMAVPPLTEREKGSLTFHFILKSFTGLEYGYFLRRDLDNLIRILRVPALPGSSFPDFKSPKTNQLDLASFGQFLLDRFEHSSYCLAGSFFTHSSAF